MALRALSEQRRKGGIAKHAGRGITSQRVAGNVSVACVICGQQQQTLINAMRGNNESTKNAGTAAEAERFERMLLRNQRQQTMNGAGARHHTGRQGHARNAAASAGSAPERESRHKG